jgi:hypothetical protein
MARKQQRSKKSQAARRKRASKPRAPRRSAGPSINISACAQKYVYAINSPFEAWSQGISEVCVPDDSLAPSSKQVFRTRGGGATGTGLYGFVSVQSGAYGNDHDAIFHSVSGNTAIATSAFNGGLYAAAPAQMTTIPWITGTILPTQREMRTVAMGIRVRCLGSKLNEGGRVACYKSPNNFSISGENFQSMLATEGCMTYPFLNNTWSNVVWAPVRVGDFTYSSLVPAPQDNELIIAVNSAVANQPFEWEVIMYCETVGPTVPSLTKTHSDAVGFSAAQQVSQIGHYAYLGKGPTLSNIVKQTAAAVRSATHFVNDHLADFRTIGGLGKQAGQAMEFMMGAL